MKKYLAVFTIAISLVANSQNNLTINGKFLNFKEFEKLNYYRVSCTVYNPVSSLGKHQFVMFDKNGEFEFKYHIEYPTILEFNSQHQNFSLAVKPDDAIKFTIDLSDTTANFFHGKSFTNSNLIIDSLLFEIKERYSNNEIKSLNPRQIEKILNGYSYEQKFFILTYLAFKKAETVSIKNEKLRFIEYYKIISHDSVVSKYNNELDDLLTKQYTDFISNLKKPDNSIVFIDKQFDTFTNMIGYIKSRHKGKIVFIDVWYTACGGCVFDLKKKRWKNLVLLDVHTIS